MVVIHIIETVIPFSPVINLYPNGSDGSEFWNSGEAQRFETVDEFDKLIRNFQEGNAANKNVWNNHGWNSYIIAATILYVYPNYEGTIFMAIFIVGYDTFAR